MIRYLFFSFSEAFTNLWRSRVLNLLSIGTIVLAIFLMGSILFVGINLKRMTVGWENEVKFHVFLEDDISEPDLKHLLQLLDGHLKVQDHLYLSKQDAKSRFQTNFKSYRDITDSIESNPFPASIQVTMVTGSKGRDFQRLRDDLTQNPGIEEIYYDQDVFERLKFAANLINMAGWFFGGMLIFASVFTISNVLKLTFFTRREEVDIMKLVGASRAYIRGPFIVEGVLQGLLGSFVGILILGGAYLSLLGYLHTHQQSLIGQLDVQFLTTPWLFILLLCGTLSGFIGSLVSLSQFLEEHISYH